MRKTDLISREELFEELNCINLPVGNETVDKIFNVIENMSSAQPEPCEDAVSRADVVDMLEMFPFTEYSEYETAREVVKRLPTAQPETYKEKLKEIADALSEEFAYMNSCLNERDIILGYLGVKRTSKIHCNTDCTNIKCESYRYNKRLPPAQPERKTGWWLIREGISDVQCSECGMYFRDVYDMENSDAFCRHCGTKMEGLKVIKNE